MNKISLKEISNISVGVQMASVLINQTIQLYLFPKKFDFCDTSSLT